MMRVKSFRLVIAAAVGAGLLVTTVPAFAIDLNDIGMGIARIFGQDPYRIAEGAIAGELPKHIGPARKYEVRLSRSGSDLGKGFLSRVDITGFDVKAENGLVIPLMEIELEDVRLDLKERSLRSVARGLFSASLGEEAITRFVRQRAGVEVKDVRVGFRDGQLLVRATPAVMGFDIPSEVAGKPVLTARDTVDFKASRVAVFGLSLPQFAVGALENQVNPVVDLSGLKLPVRITDIQVRGSELVADGTLDFSRLTGGREAAPARKGRFSRR